MEVREKLVVAIPSGRLGSLPGTARVAFCRASMVVLLVAACHQFRWGWLCFVTSEAVLRMSTTLGLSSLRLSSDTIVVHGQAVCYVTSCTFIDVLAGAAALLWDTHGSVCANARKLVIVAAVLFGFNLVRLELTQLVYVAGVSWEMADGVVGGTAYFLVWSAIWPRCHWVCRKLHSR